MKTALITWNDCLTEVAFVEYLLNDFSTISILQKTPKIVSADVATVLSVSRFAKHLEFQPLEPGTDAPADDVYSDADPFAYCAANNIAKSSGSCCPKPAKQESAGCSAKPAKQESAGCCAKPAKQESAGCGTKSAEQENGSCSKRSKAESGGRCC